MEIDIAAYYEQYGPMVLRRCKFLLKDEERALDAMQEVFVKLLENHHRLAGTYPSSLLYRIATNVCLNMLRSKSRSRTDYNPDLVEAAAGHDDVAGRAEAQDFLERLFAAEEAGRGAPRGRPNGGRRDVSPPRDAGTPDADGSSWGDHGPGSIGAAEPPGKENLRSPAAVSTREIAIMYYLDSMTYDEVARETGLSVSGIRKRLRTLKQTAKRLEGGEDHA